MSIFFKESLLLVGLASLGVTYLLMPTVRQFALGQGWIDQPDGVRKLHRGIIPRSGGMAIWFGMMGGVMVGLVLAYSLDPGLFSGLGALSLSSILGLFAGATIAACTGLLDDVFNLNALVKLAAQVLSTVPLMFCVDIVGAVQATMGGGTVAGILAMPLIMIWMLFIMNAINLIDGLDGLAGGLSLIALVVLSLIGGLAGSSLFITVALACALLAFLRYNYNPASVFMGDMGSLFIGYMLGTLSLAVLTVDPDPGRFLALVVVLGLPALDTVNAFLRRALRGGDPLAPDRDHLHHRMLAHMNGHTGKAVITFYIIAGALGYCASIMINSTTIGAFLIFGAIVAVGLLMLWELDYFDCSSYRSAPKGEGGGRPVQPPDRASGNRGRKVGPTIREPIKHRASHL